MWVDRCLQGEGIVAGIGMGIANACGWLGDRYSGTDAF